MNEIKQCLECGLDAEEMEEYKGVLVRLCERGHRTGVLEEGIKEPEFKKDAFLSVSKIALEKRVDS